MIFALIINFTPIFVGYVLRKSIICGKIEFMGGLLMIDRAVSPIKYWIYIIFALLLNLVVLVFVIYFDLVVINSWIGR